MISSHLYSAWYLNILAYKYIKVNYRSTTNTLYWTRLVWGCSGVSFISDHEKYWEPLYDTLSHITRSAGWSEQARAMPTALSRSLGKLGLITITCIGKMYMYLTYLDGHNICALSWVTENTWQHMILCLRSVAAHSVFWVVRAIFHADPLYTSNWKLPHIMIDW